MSYEVIIQPSAEADIAVALAYLIERSPDYAERWTRGLYAKIAELEDMPEAFSFAREGEEWGRPLRQLIYQSYRVIFTVEAMKVHVLHVRHAARENLPPP